MNFTSIALKFNNVLSGGILSHSSLLGADGDVVNTIEASGLTSAIFEVILNWLINLVLKVIYLVCAFVLNLIEFFQFTISSILGISVSIDDYVVLDTKNPLIKLLTSDAFLDTFKIIFGVAIVLIIVFTIFAIVKSEYAIATGGDPEANTKGRIFNRTLRSFFTLGMFPLILLASIILVNAILAGFNDILRGGENTTLAGQIFISSAYNANNYRRYADDDVRVPIIINFDDPIYLGQGSAYSTEELAAIYKNFQPTGKELYNNFADYNFDSFSSSVIYRNNRLYNEQSYSGFEKFVCTREQYYVMADFIDYAIKNNLKYYVKSVKDPDINWKYVSDSVYNKDEGTLTITYKDASNLNDGTSYTVVYAPTSEEISTPISDAIKTITALLAIGDFSENTFNILSRLEDSINVVEWETDKVLLRFSDDFRAALNRSSSTSTTLKNAMSITDKLLLYERARYEYNNSLDCSISDLASGVELPLKKLEKTVYQASSASYIVTETYYVVEINGTYYQVEENKELKDSEGNFLVDSFGDYYYTLVDSAFDLRNPTITDIDDNIVDFGSVTIGSKEVKLGSYVKADTSFEDIIIEKLNGYYEFELEDGDTRYAIYDDQVSEVIKQVSWPQKLINDLQVIYKDININQMITTGKWLEQLGEYVSASDTSGDHTGNISTGLIHPLGLILSELFLGEIEEADNFNLYGSLMFGSRFDEETVRALMLSLAGEDNYYQLVEEFEYFNEIFNVFMGPVLDEIAYYENFDLMSGNEASVQLYTYKAYLASMLISSNAAEWFYSTALSLLGNTTLAEDIVNSDGYYKSYYELPDEYKDANGILRLLYNQNLEYLESQYVEEGDAAYPEYMYALDDYINSDDESFDGRLDAVLKSVLSSEKQEERVLADYKEIVETYNAVIDFIRDEYREETILSDINSFLLVPSPIYDGTEITGGSDSFTYATQEYSIKQLKERISTMREQIEYYLDSENIGSESELLATLEQYYLAISTYVDDKIESITEDQSHKYVGERDSLVTSLNSYLAQASQYYNFVTNYGYDLSIFGIALINPSSGTFGQSDLEQAKKHEEWVNLKQQYNTMNSAISALTYDAFRVRYSVTEEEFNEFYNQLQVYSANIQNYLNTQDIIDKLDRYYIVYGVNAILSQEANISLDVTVNNKHYTVGQNFTSAKFIEYVLGAEYLNKLGYDVVFVSDDYKGLVSTSTKTVDGETVTTVTTFGTIHDFLVELGDITSVLYQMTNFVNLAGNTQDEIVIGATNIAENDLAQEILKMLISNDFLPTDILCAFFDIDASLLTVPSGSTLDEVVKGYALTLVDRANNYEYNNEKLNTVLSYLLLTDNNEEKPKYVDYTKLTLKELRIMCLQFLIDYEEQAGESVEQNQKRYLAVLALGCSDWKDTNSIGAIDNSWGLDRRATINSLSIDRQSQATILRLAGLENRPYSELVGAEYSIDFNVKTTDEANGDIFIICTFDEEIKQFIPFMMSNIRGANSAGQPIDEEGYTWLTKYGYRNSYTEYYYTGTDNKQVAFFPVIAKGIITEDGMPTAIRETDGYIEYYRDDIIIHDVSNVGLSTYFVTVDQISVNYTGFSYMANTFTQLFTGKSIVEHLVETIPRFAAHTDYNFCYGKTSEVIDSLVDGYTAISFNFDTSVCPEMANLYSLSHMNIVVLIIGVVTILTALWKALWGVTGRMFDVTVLALLGPAVITTINLRTDSKDKPGNIVESNEDIYSRWKETLSGKILNVFAYAIGFNIFFIIVPIISDLTLFETNSAFASLPLFRNISASFLNEIARVIFLIASAYLCTRAPKIFASISKTANGFNEGQTTLGNVKSTINSVGDMVSGQYAIDKIEEAKETAVNLIPGSHIAKEIQGKVKEMSVKIAAKVAKYAAMAHGVPPKVADKMSQMLEKQMAEKVNADRQWKSARAQERAIREKQRNGEKVDKKEIERANETRGDYEAGVKQRNAERKEKKKKEKAAKKGKS